MLSLSLSLLLLFTNCVSAYFTCITDKECNYQGTCEDNYCICESQWITINNTNNISCSYHQKDHYTTLMLSIFVGYFGVDQWYIENHILAGIKM